MTQNDNGDSVHSPGSRSAPWVGINANGTWKVPATLEIVREAIDEGVRRTVLFREDLTGELCIWLTSLRDAELEIAARLLRLREGSAPWQPIDGNKALPWVEEKTGTILATADVLCQRGSGPVYGLPGQDLAIDLPIEPKSSAASCKRATIPNSPARRYFLGS